LKLNITKTFLPFVGETGEIEPDSNRPFLLNNVFSQDECLEIISTLEESPGNPTFMAESPRYGFKQFLSKYLAELIWSRVSPFVPKYIQGHRVMRLMETISFKQIKSKSPQTSKHIDKFRIKNDYSSFSYSTFILYLNDNQTSELAGGETELYYENKVFKSYPKMGSILVFHGDWFHLGKEIFRGVKHISITRLILENTGYECI